MATAEPPDEPPTRAATNDVPSSGPTPASGEPHGSGESPAPALSPSPRADGAGVGLSIEDLQVRYRDAIALRDVFLTMPAGARVAVVGRNGAGKSSLLCAIAGLVPAAKGRISWAGADVTKKSVHKRVEAGISLVPEGRRIFPGLSINDNLRAGGFTSPRDIATRRAEVYAQFPVLEERAKIPAAQLSGGEAQMLAIGQALMAAPKLLLLDEPSIGLAPRIVSNLLEHIRALADQGIAVLLVEQSVRLADAFADNLYALDQGQLTAVRGPGETIDEEALRRAYFG